MSLRDFFWSCHIELTVTGTNRETGMSFSVSVFHHSIEFLYNKHRTGMIFLCFRMTLSRRQIQVFKKD